MLRAFGLLASGVMTNGLLHITNGDAAGDRIRARVPGRVLPWADVLHEGPVPAHLTLEAMSAVRARYLTEVGWATRDAAVNTFATRDATLRASGACDEVVLWFEHDLYDQLQLLQVLSWFAAAAPGSPPLSTIDAPDYLGHMAEERFPELFEARRRVSAAELSLGARGWEAFCSADPSAIVVLLEQDLGALPHLHQALVRHLQEFPDVQSGLSRSERQILEALSSGPMMPKRLFQAAHHEREERVYLGDNVFAMYVERLGRPASALLRDSGGHAPQARRPSRDDRRFWNTPVLLTALGQEVLGGQRDWVSMAGIDRWLGGVHLQGSSPKWRWDRSGRRLVVA